MRHIGMSVALAAIILPATASAQSVFDGRWRVDLGSTELPKKPWVVTLNDRNFRCASCGTPWGIPADGGFHKVAGQNYFDEAAVKRIDPRTIEFHYRKGGRLVETDRISISADGKTFTSVDTDHATPNGELAVYRSTARRSADGARGAHPLDGSWVTTSYDKGSDNTMTVTMRMEGDRFSFADGTGSHYTATLGGPPVKVEGDLAGRMIAAKRLSPNALQLDASIGGKADSRMIVTVAPDGKKMNVEATNVKQAVTTRFVAYKQ